MSADAGALTVAVKLKLDRSELDEALAGLEAARTRLLETIRAAAATGRAIETRIDGEVLARTVLASAAFQEAVETMAAGGR